MRTSGHGLASIRRESWGGFNAPAPASADIAVIAKALAEVGADDGARNGTPRQSTGPSRPGSSYAVEQRRLPGRQLPPIKAQDAATGRPDRTAQERPPLKPRKGREFSLPHSQTESQLHVSVAEFLDWALVAPAFYTTFPAGWGKLSKATAGRLYASGMKKGMPDILVFSPGSGSFQVRVVGIELKVPPNTVTSAQRTTFAKLQAVGVRVYVCTSIDEVHRVLSREQIRCRINENGQQPSVRDQSAALL